MAEINTKGIFGIGDIRKRQLAGLVPERTRETYREYGYFGGGSLSGSPGSGVSIVNRIDYSNDTNLASIRGRLTISKFQPGAAGNSNFGYFSGGNDDTNLDRIDYSNDASTSSNRGTLYGSTSSGTGNFNFGYFGGGFSNSFILRLDYSNDTSNSLRRGSFSLNGNGKAWPGAAGNSNFGWFGGGSGLSSRVDRINYSNDLATISVRGSLSLARYYLSATGNSDFGYFGGGSSPAAVSRIDRINYSNDTETTSARGLLSANSQQQAATSSASFGGSPNSSFASNFTFPTVPNAGYFGGGTDGTNNLATIDKVDYANDTATASVRSALSVARFGSGATGNSSYGYYGGGQIPGTPTPTFYSTIDRIEYTSDSQNTITRGTLSSARSYLSATGNSNFGYFGGGRISPGSTSVSTINRIDYSADTSMASVRGSLSAVNYKISATGNNNFGYFGGGNAPTVSTVDRVDYSNDTATTLIRGPLSLARRNVAASGNTNFGYFSGGDDGSSVFSIINRIDYSNDTQTATVRGSLSIAKNAGSATGSQTFGYFGGGFPPSGILSTIERINYSNDTGTALARGLLSNSKYFIAATSPLAYGGAPIYATNTLPTVFQKQIDFNDANTLNLPFKRVLGSFGYFGGGSSPGSSRVNRIDYSNDLATALVRGPLSSTRYGPSGSNNSNFGYYAKGSVSSIERIDFSNDSSIGLLRTNASNALNLSAGFSNNFYGYFCGGQFPSSSRVDRIDFSSDNIRSTRGNMINDRGEISASSTQEFGYIYGGREPVSFIQRINISNDLSLASFRSNLSSVKNSTGATGNKNFGYCGGGRTNSGGGTNISTIERLDYSNDLISPSIRGPLSSARYKLSATGNSNFGYFNGGGGGGSVSIINRIDFSNDTQTAAIRGNLSGGDTAATTNARNS